ncbi:S-adenosyl-L-homocysteine hydrolase [Segniliparus rotundus DSM 44985]|uniref:S-adenosyl-L-homocysteine hydrolase n=1 Tax=Segniliparus rotundus (strain ATCC BAA-972 / CDC 1076 / CIP 108378 / DSM 44985 / JCM 13578) TaxID=640132 RepID=D6Z9K2_SEGRD|nr:hypothetical protein [Segniliparus rotundus]ADG96529.1 S-adenosyl-L-homocysteine hydrolase [Segniliparus rotundus DSM 44985]
MSDQIKKADEALRAHEEAWVRRYVQLGHSLEEARAAYRAKFWAGEVDLRW